MRAKFRSLSAAPNASAYKNLSGELLRLSAHVGVEKSRRRNRGVRAEDTHSPARHFNGALPALGKAIFNRIAAHAQDGDFRGVAVAYGRSLKYRACPGNSHYRRTDQPARARFRRAEGKISHLKNFKHSPRRSSEPSLRFAHIHRRKYWINSGVKSRHSDVFILARNVLQII